MVKKRKAKGSTTDPSRRGVQKKRLAADQIEVSQRDVLEAPPQLAAIDNTTSDFPMFPIVGVGASAGGLEAFSELLAALPKEINFAVVLVQHMAPERKSELPELLRAKTKIPVVQLAAEMAIEPGRIYVIPPNVQLEIMQERFHVSPRPVDHAHLMPIDVFFHSLALRAGDRAVGVVLSGTASDGAMGLRDIKAYGGITIARQPDTARFDGMPTAAIAAEGVDLVRHPSRCRPLRPPTGSFTPLQGVTDCHREGLQVKTDGALQGLDLDVIPFGGSGQEGYFLILFKETLTPPAASKQADRGKKTRGRRNESEERIALLQQELTANREHMQLIIQDLESANEELQSANEEVLSSNEELQSTNEELDTAKEELQSTNEELNTVNSELHDRNNDLRQINSDLVNLLGNVQIVIVDGGLRIRRFTPMAQKILNLIPGDLGRPIGQIKPNVDCPELEAMIKEAIESVRAVDREVQDQAGTWYSLRVRPYQTLDNRIEGDVVALIDIDVAKRYQNALELSRDYAVAIVVAIDRPLAIVDDSLRVLRANSAFCTMFGQEMQEITHRLIYDVGDGQWDRAGLRKRLEEILPNGQGFDDFAVSFEASDGGRNNARVSARPVAAEPGKPSMIFLAVNAPVDGAE